MIKVIINQGKTFKVIKNQGKFSEKSIENRINRCRSETSMDQDLHKGTQQQQPTPQGRRPPPLPGSQSYSSKQILDKF
jgi:hypothetical protein